MEQSKIRRPAVAGQFYHSSKLGLEKQIKGLIDVTVVKTDAIACMVPHAGYMYSGNVAAATFSNINIKDKVILLGPNHTGLGHELSIMTEGSWITPIGEVRIDDNFAKKLVSDSKFLKDDPLAHLSEHSLEVELPFLQYLKTNFSIIPIAFLSDDLKILREIGKEIADSIKSSGIENSVTIVASSDMTHYEPANIAKEKDMLAIESILELNEEKLMRTLREFNVSMCGYAPVVCMLSLAKALGAKNSKLIKYQTSGDITGDYDSVVGYAGIIIY
ncbi:MAG: AmmeMemoRadiSam system protein B [Candidatus Omnitrophota bacterium]